MIKPVFFLMLLLAPTVVAAAPTSDTIFPSSEWRNPKNTVHIRAESCGGNLCGTVTWASASAKADSGGNLVGTEILRDFQPEGRGSWRGNVYVPDVRRTFAGTLKFVDANTMIGKGCVLFGLVCKTQTWTRLR